MWCAASHGKWWQLVLGLMSCLPLKGELLGSDEWKPLRPNQEKWTCLGASAQTGSYISPHQTHQGPKNWKYISWLLKINTFIINHYYYEASIHIIKTLIYEKKPKLTLLATDYSSFFYIFKSLHFNYYLDYYYKFRINVDMAKRILIGCVKASNYLSFT